MRKLTRTLFPALMVVALAAGCGGNGTTDPTSPDAAPTDPEATDAVPERGDADLVIWTDALKITAVQEVADAFADSQGISVAVQAIAADLQPNFVTANAAGNGPDVVVGAHDWIGNLVQNGAIDPLQLTPDQLEGYSEKAVQATTYDGQLYGVPYGIEAIALYRNAGIVADEPATLDEAIAAGQAAVDAGEVDSALNLPVGELGDAYHMQPILTSMGGYLFGQNDDGTYRADDVGIGEPGSVAAAEKISELAEAGVLRSSISNDNSIALFTEGKAAFLISGPWALGDIEESGLDYAIQPIPGFGGQEPAAPFMGAQAFMVASNGQNKAFAQEFVTNGVNNEAAMQTLFDLAHLPPSMLAVQEGLEDEDTALFAEAANQGDPMPAIPEMSAVWEPLGKAYAAIVGGADPAATIRSAGDQIRSSIGE